MERAKADKSDGTEGRAETVAGWVKLGKPTVAVGGREVVGRVQTENSSYKG